MTASWRVTGPENMTTVRVLPRGPEVYRYCRTTSSLRNQSSTDSAGFSLESSRPVSLKACENFYLEGRKIELELSASDANISIISRESRQPIIARHMSDVVTRLTVHAYK